MNTECERNGGPSSAGWFKSSEFGFRVHLLELCCIDASSCRVTAKDTSGSAAPRRAEIDLYLFRLHQKRAWRRMEKNVDSHLGFEFPVRAPGFVRAVSFLFLKVFINQGLDGFKTAKSTRLPGMRGRGAPSFPIRVTRCTPVIPSVGLDLLPCSFTFAIALTDVKISVRPS